MTQFSSPFRVALLALTAGIFACPAAAQDIYVKPNSGGGSTAPSVEYGVTKRPKEAPKPTPQNSGAAPGPAAPVNPGPTVAKPPAPAPAPVTPSPQPVSPPPDFSQYGGATLYSMPEDSPPEPGAGPNIITIKFEAGGLGPNDKNLAAQNLGLSEPEILSNCVFRYSTVLAYSSGGSMLASGTAAAVQHRYTGPLSTVQISPILSCRKLKQPIAGLILEQKSYYNLSLTTIDCPPGDKAGASAVSLGFRYTGDGTAECRYQ